MNPQEIPSRWIRAWIPKLEPGSLLSKGCGLLGFRLQGSLKPCNLPLLQCSKPSLKYTNEHSRYNSIKLEVPKSRQARSRWRVLSFQFRVGKQHVVRVGLERHRLPTSQSTLGSGMKGANLFLAPPRVPNLSGRQSTVQRVGGRA